MDIIKDFIPAGAKNRPGLPMKPKYITVHNTGNTNKGADAFAHATFLKGEGSKSETGWHFTVDDKCIVQHIPTNENAWHATDGNGSGNRQSIGIEICVNSDGNYALAEANAIELIRYLMKQYGIPINNVVPHQKWYPVKYCPYKILPKWDDFINEIKGVKSDVVTYTVVAGDNLTKIAAKFGVSLVDLQKANPQITNFGLINVGDRINIPLLEQTPFKPDPLANVPEWVRPSVKKLVDRGTVHEPIGDNTFYRIIYIMDKLGLL